MADVVIPPGLVGLRHKRSGEVTAHFPVDLKEIMSANKGEYEIVDDGAMEAARLSPDPLKKIQSESDSKVATVPEGMKQVTMTNDQAAAFEAFLASQKAADPVKVGGEKVADAKVVPTK